MVTYNIIGDCYNRTRKADSFIVQRIKQLLAPKKKLIYMDIGCGTGNYTIALAEDGITLQGVDPSEKMLSEASSKNNKITWTISVAENLPFEDNHFSGAIATLTMHHWHNLQQGFNEIYRVLKSGSAFVIFTATAEQMKNYWLNYYFPSMMQKSIEQMPTLKTITDAAHSAGFELLSETKYLIKDDLQDLFLYSGKNNPSLYLDNEVRQNISSFVSLASKKEINYGLKRLSADITSGHFQTVKSAFETDKGDYLFIKICKPVSSSSY